MHWVTSVLTIECCIAMTRRAVARENVGGLGAAPWWRALGYSVNGNGNGEWKMENGKW